MVDTLFSWALSHKQKIIYVWFVFYAALLSYWAYGASEIMAQEPGWPKWTTTGILFGRIAAVVFVVVLVPGMATRFGIKHKLLSLLRIFRRYLGIAMYLLTFTHMSFVFLVPRIARDRSIMPSTFFVWCGVTAFLLLFLLFITSNDWSTRVLGIWWYRIHRLIYVALGLIFFHTYLQRVSEWSIFMGITLIIFAASWIFHWIKLSAKKSPPNS